MLEQQQELAALAAELQASRDAAEQQRKELDKANRSVIVLQHTHMQCAAAWRAAEHRLSSARQNRVHVHVRQG